jgi:hypothetical protein
MAMSSFLTNGYLESVMLSQIVVNESQKMATGELDLYLTGVFQ